MHARLLASSLFLSLPVALLVPGVASADAGRADPHGAARTEHDHAATLELQARFGAGGSWIDGDRSFPGVPDDVPAAPGGILGVVLALRDYRSGLGAALAYSHVFVGGADHFGTHGVDLRLSERFTFFRTRRSQHPLELSFLAEAGMLIAAGGVTDGCSDWGLGSCDDHVDTSVPMTIAGAVGALGLSIQYDVLLVGVAAEGRVVGALAGPIDGTFDVLGTVRIGFVADLGG